MKRTAIPVLMISMLLSTVAQAQNVGLPGGQAKLERQYIADLVRSGASVVQSQQGEFTLVSTYENFSVTMPDGTFQDRGVVARVIDKAGNHVAELLVIEPAGIVTWRVYGEDLSEPIEVSGFELERASLENRFSAANPAKALTWAHDMLLGIWQGEHSPDLLTKDALLSSKDTVGCDGLHWLDNSSLRPCCDDHDMCYETNSCTAASWNPFNSSWECTNCNINVVACFGLFYWLHSGIYWEWCWGLSCCDSYSWPCIIIECT